MKMMLRLKYARRHRILFSSNWNALFSSSATTQSSPSCPFFPSSTPTTGSDGSQMVIHPNDVTRYFREWFLSRKDPLFDLIFEILRSKDDSSVASALSRLNLSLNENLILDVFDYGREDVLSCLKFFDWCGRQPGFYHTRATFNAIFRILSKPKLMGILTDFLETYRKQKYLHKVRYYNVLVIGYSVAGKPELALQLFARSRFYGLDLDGFSYHVLMNSLVEQGSFDVVDTLVKEIRCRGFQNDVTHAIMVKGFCRQNELEKAEVYLRTIVQEDGAQLSGFAVGTLVDAFCKDNQFEKAALLLDEFQRMGMVSVERAYDLWITNLVKAKKLDGALGFLKDKQAIEGYVPDVFRYNMLIKNLLRENRMEEVHDLLVDMKVREILPDDTTLNAVLCFLCKGGMMDIVMDLYDSRAEFGLSVNYMAYNYLINTLVGNGCLDVGCRVLRNSVEHGYLPGPKTFSYIAEALYREGNFSKMTELVRFMLDQSIMSNEAYSKFISAMCGAGRYEEVYLMHGLLERLKESARKRTYINLIRGFSKSGRVAIAGRVLIEMQEKGYSPSRKLLKEVICSLCKTDNAENQIGSFLEIQLALHQFPTPVIYNLFIDGAGNASKPELASQVYEMMRRNGVKPDLNSDILLLRSYLSSKKIFHALHLFFDMSMRWRNVKLWNTMVVGLCKVGKPEHASRILDNMKANKLRPSVECYEELIKEYCGLRQYYKAINLVNDMTQMGRQVSSFIGNVFLLHALKTRNVYNAWVYSSHKQNLTPASWMMGHLIGVFSGSIEGIHDAEELERLIQQCFRMDIYTINLVLRRLNKDGVDHASKFFDKLLVKGFEANRWTYDSMVHGLAKDGRIAEARKLMGEMLCRGFDLTDVTKNIIRDRCKVTMFYEKDTE